MPKTKHLLIGLIAVLILSSCKAQKEASREADYGYLEQPYEGHFKVGTPYKIKEQWYHPKVNAVYTEQGIASWYGDAFHNKQTSNGDNFNKMSLTAAHRTLPLPSMVRVTNLDNGHSVIVMINDRGPFTKDPNRIIDVSQRAAELLDFKQKGVANVRVEYLPKQTEELMHKLGLSDAKKNEIKNKAKLIASTEFEKKEKKVAVTGGKNNKAQKADAKNVKSSGHYYVQIGAYKSKKIAETWQKKVQKFGKANVTKVTKKGVTLYRVRVGSFVSKQKAKEILEKIKVSGNINPIIIKD